MSFGSAASSLRAESICCIGILIGSVPRRHRTCRNTTVYTFAAFQFPSPAILHRRIYPLASFSIRFASSSHCRIADRRHLVELFRPVRVFSSAFIDLSVQLLWPARIYSVRPMYKWQSVSVFDRTVALKAEPASGLETTSHCCVVCLIRSPLIVLLSPIWSQLDLPPTNSCLTMSMFLHSSGLSRFV